MSRPIHLFIAILILASLFVMPDTTQAVEVDPYLRKSLTVSLYFVYERNKSTSKNTSFENLNTAFSQRYHLDMLGNIISRWLMTYNTGLHYARSTFNSSQHKTTNDSWYYYLSTTLLPKSKIPLTMYFNNSKSINRTILHENWRNVFSYGVDWRGNFRKLPQTHFTFKSIHNKDSNNAHTVNSQYNLNFKKNIGVTENSLDNEYNINEDRVSDIRNGQFSTNFLNRTIISRTTQLTVSAAASKAYLANGNESSATGMTTSLNSTPSSNFRHNHSYSFTSIKSEVDADKNTSEHYHYSGAMRYKISSRVSSSAQVQVTNSKSDSSTFTRDADSFSTSANVSYTATSHLRFSESVSYSKNTSSSIDTLGSTLDNRSNFRITSRANYSNKYSWTSFNASGSIGYRNSHSEVYGDGAGLETGASTSLSGINVVPLIILNTGGVYSSSRASGGLSNTSTSYNVSANNRSFNKYINLSSSYRVATTETNAISSNTKNTNINFAAQTDYINSLPMSYSITYTKFTDYFSGYNTNLNKIFSISHQRTFLRGPLMSSFVYMTKDNTFNTGEQHIKTRKFETSYERGLTRNIGWRAKLIWNHDDADDSVIESRRFINRLTYRLRSWFVTAQHTYLNHIQNDSSTIETTLMLTASRSFGFSWR